jgi:hypothetical protein
MSYLVDENSAGSEISTPETPATVARKVCSECFEFLDLDDNFCRCCGRMTDVGKAMVKIGKLPPPASGEVPEKPLSWTESPVVVLLGLFVLLGPLALPMLWRSRRFTRSWKIGLTCVVLLIAVAACWYLVDIWNKAIEEYQRMGLL